MVLFILSNPIVKNVDGSLRMMKFFEKLTQEDANELVDFIHKDIHPNCNGKVIASIGRCWSIEMAARIFDIYQRLFNSR